VSVDPAVDSGGALPVVGFWCSASSVGVSLGFDVLVGSEELKDRVAVNLEGVHEAWIVGWRLAKRIEELRIALEHSRVCKDPREVENGRAAMVE